MDVLIGLDNPTHEEWDAWHREMLALRAGFLATTYVSLADARAYASWHRQRLPTEAEWQWVAEGRFPVARGPRPIDSHAKYILLSDGLDRSATITFRTVTPRDTPGTAASAR